MANKHKRRSGINEARAALSPPEPDPRAGGEAKKETRRDCTCTGYCKGANGLGPDWRCALDHGYGPHRPPPPGEIDAHMAEAPAQCGAKDPLSDRRCRMPRGHEGNHDEPAAEPGPLDFALEVLANPSALSRDALRGFIRTAAAERDALVKERDDLRAQLAALSEAADEHYCGQRRSVLRTLGRRLLREQPFGITEGLYAAFEDVLRATTKASVVRAAAGAVFKKEKEKISRK